MNLGSKKTRMQGLFTTFEEVTAECAPGQTAYVTLTGDTERPYGAVVVGPGDTLLATATGRTITGLAQLIRHRLPAGSGEAAR